jgi:3-hydroxymyristoyl/3-hydroxydecanoyl-(acyl carrier protein) dehydratase
VLGVLCPLLCGAAFAREPVCDVAALAQALDATRAGIWVTVPAQLSDALTRERRSLAGLVAVVSAAVPAEDSLLAACAEHLGLPILQVLDHPLSGGRTRERGLFDIEAKLRACAGVRDAALVVPERGPYAGRVLAWIDAQPGVTEAGLRESLREVWVGPLEPARILLRDRVPRDALGEVRRAALLRGFTLRADGEPLRVDVDFGEHEARLIDGRAEHEFHLHVPEDYAYFDGHFPGYPILPGAAQLGELVMPCVRRARPALGQLSAMSQLKFLGRILPGDAVQVVLAFREAEATVDFTLRCRSAVAATGRLTFTAQPTLGGDDV